MYVRTAFVSGSRKSRQTIQLHYSFNWHDYNGLLNGLLTGWRWLDWNLLPFYFV